VRGFSRQHKKKGTQELMVKIHGVASLVAQVGIKKKNAAD
jgi:hypothetical protein